MKTLFWILAVVAALAAAALLVGGLAAQAEPGGASRMLALELLGLVVPAAGAALLCAGVASVLGRLDRIHDALRRGDG